jgi:hypothetical protein
MGSSEFVGIVSFAAGGHLAGEIVMIIRGHPHLLRIGAETQKTEYQYVKGIFQQRLTFVNKSVVSR